MSAFTCEVGEHMFDYREKLVISDGNVRCCETGILVPSGQPYALCEGIYGDELTDFEQYPQALEVWRFLRQLRRSDGSCFSFGYVEEAMSEARSGNEEQKLIADSWEFIKKRISKRYSEGSGPKLDKAEKEALDSGLWFKWIQFPSIGYWWVGPCPPQEPCPPSHPGGEPWAESVDSFICASCYERRDIEEKNECDLCGSCEVEE